jgi:hypothetical protein
LTKTIVLSREESTMASSWTEHLCIEPVGPGQFQLSTCKPEWLGSIYDLVPEDELYSESGELIVPDTWDGKKITGLGDSEYLETDVLLPGEGEAESSIFDASSIAAARDFCESDGWTTREGFENGWQKIQRLVLNAR